MHPAKSMVSARAIGNGSEWSYDRKDYNPDHEQGRDLVDRPVKLRRMPVAILRELAPPARKRGMSDLHADQKRQLGMEPALAPMMAPGRQRQAQDPGRDHG